jgi:hypothetical protein
MLLFNLYTTPSNDLDDPGRISLVQRALTALAPGGEPVLIEPVLIEPVLIEPALRETSRDLHRVHDHVLGPRAGPCARAVHAGGRARSWPRARLVRSRPSSSSTRVRFGVSATNSTSISLVSSSWSRLAAAG